MEIVAALAAGVASILLGAIANLLHDSILPSLRRRYGIRLVPKSETPGDTTRRLVEQLHAASDQIDTVVRELITDVRGREEALRELVARSEELTSQELELKKRVEVLQNVPLEAAEYFARISQQSLQDVEKRSSKRDLILFGLGVVVTTVIAIILKLIGIG